MVHPVLDRIIERFTGSEHTDEVARAKATYFERTGPIDEETSDLDARMAAFLEWYLFDWPLASGRTPAEEHYLQQAALLEGSERKVALELCATHHSLFAVYQLGSGWVDLDDLVGGGRFRVDERRTLTLEPGDLLEARLLPIDDRILFSPSFAFHPHKARAAIGEVVAQLRAERRAHSTLMLELGRMRLDAERYRHVPVGRIYRLAGVLGGTRPLP